MKKNILERTGIIPSLNQINLFLISITAILFLARYFKELIQILFIGYWDAGRYSEPMMADGPVWTIMLILVIVYGIILSFRAPFIDFKKENDFNKDSMLLFAVLFNVIVGLSVGFHVLSSSTNLIYLILGALNIIDAIILFFLFRVGYVDKEVIIEKKVKNLDIIVGMAGIFLIFFLNEFIFMHHWSINLSMCTVFSIHIINTFSESFSELSLN